MGVVHEPPSTCRFRCVGVAFAVLAEWHPANKLTGVVAFVCGLLSAHAAPHCGVLGAYAAFASGFALAAPCKIKGAVTHAPPPRLMWEVAACVCKSQRFGLRLVNLVHSLSWLVCGGVSRHFWYLHRLGSCGQNKAPRMGLYPFTSLSASAGLPRNQERKISRVCSGCGWYYGTGCSPLSCHAETICTNG